MTGDQAFLYTVVGVAVAALTFLGLLWLGGPMDRTPGRNTPRG